MVLDGNGVPGELLDVVVAEAETVPQGSLNRHEVDGPADLLAVRVGHLEAFSPSPPLEDGGPAGLQRGLVDVELIRVHGALDHGLAQAVGGRDEHGVLEPGLRVHREHNAGAPTSERTIRWMPAESATSACSNLWCTR